MLHFSLQTIDSMHNFFSGGTAAKTDTRLFCITVSGKRMDWVVLMMAYGAQTLKCTVTSAQKTEILIEILLRVHFDGQD